MALKGYRVGPVSLNEVIEHLRSGSILGGLGGLIGGDNRL
jgi:hypothetical protein